MRSVCGASKANRSRPAEVIFTGDVVKDILNNPVYRGKVTLSLI